MIKPIFIGKNKPSDEVISAIRNLSINIDGSHYRGVTLIEREIKKLINDQSWVKLTNLVLQKSYIKFEVTCVDPINGRKYAIDSNDNSVYIDYTGGLDIDLAGEDYYISPCCVTFPRWYRNSQEYNISCKSPIECYLEDNKLKISINKNLNIINNEYEDTESTDDDSDIHITTAKPHIKTLNGVRVTNGNINITGVGGVTVDVAYM